jgi:hypothetical protein
MVGGLPDGATRCPMRLPVRFCPCGNFLQEFRGVAAFSG